MLGNSLAQFLGGNGGASLLLYPVHKNMNIKKKTFILVGLFLGLLYGVWPIIYAYTEAPSMPGPYEAGVQVLFIIFWGIIGLALGFLVGSMTNFLKKRKK